MKKKITITIITKNEALNIEKCLNSVCWADEIVVVDSDSTDKTVAICEKYGCKIYSTPWLGFGKTKQFCVEKSTNDWILSIDADEVLSEELQKRILSLDPGEGIVGYRIKRKSFYLGSLINFSGWQNDYPLRLFNKNYGKFTDDIVHEKVILNGKTETINELIYHHTYPDIDSHIVKINHYSGLGAKRLFLNGKKSGVIKPVMRSLFKFFRTFFLKFGFLDGKEGFILACISGFGVFLKYYKLWELNSKSRG